MQHLPRPFLLAALVVCFAVPAGAQVPSDSAEATSSPAAQAKADSARPAGRPDQQIERIRTQDAGSRIDELRVGGETQSITVQPAANVPAYEVKPTDTSRAGSASDTGSTGSRFWNVFKF
jgi:hypothetical protein